MMERLTITGDLYLNPRGVGVEIFAGWPVKPAFVPGLGYELGHNLVVNAGRQAIANALGGMSGQNLRYVSFGTYDEAPRFDDLTLSPQATPGGPAAGSNEIELTTGVYKKEVTLVEWPQPCTVRVSFALDYGEANGYLIREAGLWTDGLTLFARKVFPAIRKAGDGYYEFAWLIRT